MRALIHRRRALLAALLAGALAVAPAATAFAPAAGAATLPLGASATSLETANSSSSLETAASRASSTGRTIAFSLIGLALAVAGVILVFRRDFKEAVGVLAIGIIAIMLASPVGLSVLENTVSTLFGSG
jgi:hypothetical protein